MEYKRNLKYITPTIVIFSFSIVYFLIMLVMNYNEKEEFIISKSISDSSFIFLFISSFTVPGFILHYRYEMLNKNRKITFKQNFLEITTETEIENVLYSDILEVENHTVSWKGRNPWSDYNYVKLCLKNGEKIYYNCLTEKINSENNLLKSDRIKKFKIEDIYPWY
jgi:hypothetical protein